jgi:hypothetical protein
MSWSDLARSSSGDAVQEFPLTTASKTDAGTTSGAGGDGVHTGVQLITCCTDGAIAITYADATTVASKSFVEGQGRSFPFGATITILSGTFDIA